MSTRKRSLERLSFPSGRENKTIFWFAGSGQGMSLERPASIGFGRGRVLFVTQPLALIVFLLSWGLAAGREADAAESKPPNIVFLLTDDQHWDSLGCMGNKKIQTPNLDRMAGEGILFRDAFVTASVCSVSRAAILTGAYPCSRSSGDLAAMVTPKGITTTYPAVLQAGGYETGYIGKWDVGSGEDGFRMGMKLFDYWGADRLHGNYWHEADCPFVTNDGRNSKEQIKCTCPPKGSDPRVGSAGMIHPVHFDRDIVPIKARQFLEGRNRDKPFFLAISFRGPKDPWSDFPPDREGLYRSNSVVIPATATEADAKGQPAFLRASMASDYGLSLVKNPGNLANEIGKNYRLVSTIDSTVGKLRELLARQGLDTNTIIVYTSDNGHFYGEHGFWGKWLPYEESLRVPLIVYDPRLAKDQQGKSRDQMILNIDLAPTFLSWAGLNIPSEIQGRSFEPLVCGETIPWRKEFYHEFTWAADGKIVPSEGIRSADWKYIRFFDRKPVVEQLFDLKKDPGETVDLSLNPDSASILQGMRDRTDQYRVSLQSGQTAEGASKKQ
jgi:arylsulfatase A-like enzyme